MILEDYKAIKEIIDDIVGVETKQGENLKIAIKNYFDTKPKDIKLVNNKVEKNMSSSSIESYTDEAEAAMKRYTAKLNKELSELKINGGYCKVDSSE